MRIIQITDTHLSPTKLHFNGNWSPLIDWMADQKPDLIIHTGDFTVDGADVEDDLIFCRELMADLPAPMLCLPGNHDIGHLPASRQPVNTERLQRWRDHFGPEYWTLNFGQWLLIGLNSLIMGDGSVLEEKQFHWLEQQLNHSEGCPVAIFAHKPLFIDSPDEGETGLWGIPPVPRQRLMELFARHHVQLHASGHLHRAWSGEAAGISYVWAPSAGFVAHAIDRELPGDRIVGAVIHDLDDTATSKIVEIETLSHHVIDDVMHEVYPSNLNREKLKPQENPPA